MDNTNVYISHSLKAGKMASAGSGEKGKSLLEVLDKPPEQWTREEGKSLDNILKACNFRYVLFDGGDIPPQTLAAVLKAYRLDETFDEEKINEEWCHVSYLVWDAHHHILSRETVKERISLYLIEQKLTMAEEMQRIVPEPAGRLPKATVEPVLLPLIGPIFPQIPSPAIKPTKTTEQTATKTVSFASEPTIRFNKSKALSVPEIMAIMGVPLFMGGMIALEYYLSMSNKREESPTQEYNIPNTQEYDPFNILTSLPKTKHELKTGLPAAALPKNTFYLPEKEKKDVESSVGYARRCPSEVGKDRYKIDRPLYPILRKLGIKSGQERERCGDYLEDKKILRDRNFVVRDWEICRVNYLIKHCRHYLRK